MRTISITLPDNIELSDIEISMSLAAKLYEDGKLTLGQSAYIARLTKRAFAELLGSYGVFIFNYPSSELMNDVGNA